MSNMKTPKYTVGQTATYNNNGTYTGRIVQTPTESVPYYTIIDSDAGMQLWNAGLHVGANVTENQITSII